ncbi:hypothetical protein NL676_006747 [Syzygium grande]|nr:hypothetical protein NL676_006747 [Syzygium grande]
MRLKSRYPDQSCSLPRESEPDSPSVGIPISSPYDPFTNCLSPRPKFLCYDPERFHEILGRLEEANDVFGGAGIGSDSEGSFSEDSAKQGQEGSDSDGASNEVEMPQIFSLRWLCELLLLLLVLVLFMVCTCNTRITSLPQNFEDWHKRSSYTYEVVSEKMVEFDEIDVSNKSISSPSDEVRDIEGRYGNLSFTHEEASEKIVEFFDSGRNATQTDVDSSSEDIGDAAEWIEVMKGMLRENYRYDELGETGEVWKRVEVEPEESSKAAETRVEKNDDVCEQENGGVESNFYWIKKSLEPQGSGIAEPEVGSDTDDLPLEETREVGEVASALVGIESVTNAVLYSSAAAVLAFVLLVLHSRRKKKLGNDSSPATGHSFIAPPIKCPREFAEKPGREDHFAPDPVSSSPLESSPSLGSFTTTEMISTKREDGTGEAWISIATPVRRSSRIRDRAMRIRRHLMSLS